MNSIFLVLSNYHFRNFQSLDQPMNNVTQRQWFLCIRLLKHLFMIIIFSGNDCLMVLFMKITLIINMFSWTELILFSLFSKNCNFPTIKHRVGFINSLKSLALIIADQ
jgi:hypothetical protein